MALTNIPLADITEDHFRRLIEAQTAESLHVEYKRQTYGGTEDQRREFLADVSSFANAAGGDIIVGMVEKQGMPTEFNPFTGNVDEERLRLEQMARDGINPRITNLQTRAIPLSGGGSIIVVRIPKSYNPPHRVIFRNSGRFFARSSAGRYEPNVEELRRIFTEAPLLAERIRAFREERVARIAAGQTPVDLLDRCLLVLHVVPFSAFGFGAPAVSLDQVETQAHRFAPIGGRTTDYRANFDGMLTGSNADGLSAPQRAYLQLFRTGTIEAVVGAPSQTFKSVEALRHMDIDALIVRHARAYISALQPFGVEPPYAVLVSLAGARGWQFLPGFPSSPFIELSSALTQDQFHFAEAIFEDVPGNFNESARKLRGTLDQIANCAGMASSPFFNSDGDYTLVNG